MPLSRPRTLLLLAVTLTPRLASAQLYSLIDLGDLPGGANQSTALSINKHSYVTGTSGTTGGTGSTGHPYLWNPGNQTMSDLGVLDPNNDWGDGYAVSDGYVAGWGGFGSGVRAFRWDANSGLINLGDLPGGLDRSFAHGVNDLGQVTGRSNSGVGDRAYVWSPATQQMTDIGDLPGGGTESSGRDINNNGFVAGWADAATGERGFVWDPNTQQMADLGDLPGGADKSRAYAINDGKYIVGESWVSGGTHAFLWNPNSHLMFDLGDLPGGQNSSVAHDLNSSNFTVGMSWANSGKAAFLWTPVGGMIDLNNHLDGSGAGWYLQSAQGINDLGEIVGIGFDPRGNTHGYLLRPVPAPSSSLFLGAGLVGFRRRRRSAESWSDEAAPLSPQSSARHSCAQIALTAAVLFTAASGASAQIYSLTDLGDLPGGANASFAAGINNHTYVTGNSSTSTPNGSSAGHPFLWSPTTQTMQDLGVLDFTRSEGYGEAISNTGIVVGSSMNSAGIPRAFSWDSISGMVDLGDLPGGGNTSRAYGVNDAGYVTGTGSTAVGSRAFVRSPKTQQMIDLGDLPGGGQESHGWDINAAGNVVGYADATNGERAFLWLAATQQMTDLGTGDGSRAFAINDAGYVAGRLGAAGHAFLWNPSTLQYADLGDLPGGLNASEALDINSSNAVVGWSWSGNGKSGFLWTPSGGMKELHNLVDSTAAGWRLMDATGINDLGEIVGIGFTPAGDWHGYLLRPVPTPSSAALLGMSVLRRRRRAR